MGIIPDHCTVPGRAHAGDTHRLRGPCNGIIPDLRTFPVQPAGGTEKRTCGALNRRGGGRRGSRMPATNPVDIPFASRQVIHEAQSRPPLPVYGLPRGWQGLPRLLSVILEASPYLAYIRPEKRFKAYAAPSHPPIISLFGKHHIDQTEVRSPVGCAIAIQGVTESCRYVRIDM